MIGIDTKKESPPCSGGDPLVIRLGLKPRTHSLEGCCSIQLSYRTKHFGKLNIHLTPVRFFMLLFRLLSIVSAKVITFLLLCKKKLVFQFL